MSALIPKPRNANQGNTGARHQSIGPGQAPLAGNSGAYRTNNAQQNGIALPNSSDWAGTRSNLNQHPPQNYNRGSSNPGLLPSPPGLAAWQNQFHSSNIQIFLQATGVICEKLSSGLENPDIFVSNFNDILSQQGYSVIQIPDVMLDNSKQIFMNKGVNAQTHNLSQMNSNFHAPTMLQNNQTILSGHHNSTLPHPNQAQVSGPSSSQDSSSSQDPPPAQDPSAIHNPTETQGPPIAHSLPTAQVQPTASPSLQTIIPPPPPAENDMPSTASNTSSPINISSTPPQAAPNPPSQELSLTSLDNEHPPILPEDTSANPSPTSHHPLPSFLPSPNSNLTQSTPNLSNLALTPLDKFSATYNSSPMPRVQVLNNIHLHSDIPQTNSHNKHAKSNNKNKADTHTTPMNKIYNFRNNVKAKLLSYRE